jgi:hypothetical protein
MKRPEFVSDNDLSRWNENIKNDPNLPPSLLANPIIKEVCYAGQWISEELKKLQCPDVLIVRIMHAAGGLSFGRDIWDTHKIVLEKYKNNELDFEPEPFDMN